MRILVTGAAGFIGSHFVDYVLENHPEDQVIGFDCLTYAGNMKNLELTLLNKRFQFVKGDIRNADDVNTVVPKVDAIVNFAAETHVDRSIASSGEFVSTNVLGVNVLLESALEHKIEIFHQISTDEVYGSKVIGMSSEEDSLLPTSPYAASKAAADLLVDSFRITHGMQTIITRASNNYGSRQYPEKLIPFFLSKLLRNEKVPVYGTGENIRDWLNVFDHTTALDLVLRGRRTSNIYNISGNCLKSNNEIILLLLNLTGRTIESLDFVKDRKGHDFRYAMCGKLMKNEFNFKPQKTLEEELPKIVNFYKKILLN